MENQINETLKYYHTKRQEILKLVNSKRNLTADQIIDLWRKNGNN